MGTKWGKYHRRIALRLSEREAHELQLLVDERGTSASQVVRDALADVLRSARIDRSRRQAGIVLAGGGVSMQWHTPGMEVRTQGDAQPEAVYSNGERAEPKPAGGAS